ncbi:mechanosensitive ion channel family protein [Alkalicaulis satelles]|uniref:mechanosensitive ion channel family protein n=1 Tax=Alkalicaulis satelles TaxID=2609175 RepID=UPI001E329E9A|nr:mechanosensitive ion channel domain-containing protein [Alkalicaulis satelles]
MDATGMNIDIEQLTDMMASIGLAVLSNVALAALILVAGLYVAGFISKRVRTWAIAHPRIDTTLALFFASVVKYVIIAVVIIAVLTRFGVETTSLVAALGAMTLAVGLALQGTLSNVASGVMIVFFRPYKIGDFVDISGTMGTVKDINLFLTELNTPDNKQIIVPNGRAWGNVITNFSGYQTRRVDFTFSVDYDTDLELAREVIRHVLEADERVHKDPAVFVEVGKFGDSSIDFFARGWVNAPDFWPVFWDVNRRIKLAFDAAGISIPFPHRVMVQKDGGAPGKPSGARSPAIMKAAASAAEHAAKLTYVAPAEALPEPAPEPAPEPSARKTTRKPRAASAAKTGAASKAAAKPAAKTSAKPAARKPAAKKAADKPASAPSRRPRKPRSTS